MQPWLDLNGNLGDGLGPWGPVGQERLLPWLSSVNVPCGLHSGDPDRMLQAIDACSQRGVAVGAHVGWPDRQGFGLRPMDLMPASLKSHLLYQLGALEAMLRTRRMPLNHVRAQGAFGDTVDRDPGVACVLLETLEVFDPTLPVLAAPGSALAAEAQRLRRPVACFMAPDASLDGAGKLRAESHPGVEEDLVARIIRLVRLGRIRSAEGLDLSIHLDGLHFGGDLEAHQGLLPELHAALRLEQVAVRPIHRGVAP